MHGTLQKIGFVMQKVSHPTLQPLICIIFDAYYAFSISIHAPFH
jgi:hypothetical protein